MGGFFSKKEKIESVEKEDGTLIPVTGCISITLE
jgi:hypothetical protein